MAERNAGIEQVNHDTWSAWVVADGVVVGGQGNTREDAVMDLREGIDGMMEYLADNGIQIRDMYSLLSTLETNL